MKKMIALLRRRFLKSQSGQVAAVMLVSISTTMAISGLSIESAHIYYAYRLLQASTNAAALAAANQMPDIGTSSSPASGSAYYSLHQYSSESGQLNATTLLTNASISGNFYCSSSTVATSLSVGCMAPPSGEGSCSGSASGCNAVTATQTATIPLWFGGLVGFSSLNVQAVASAAMAGGYNTPWNIAIVMDTTKSMADSDTDSQCSGTQIVCALAGLTDLLDDLYPCQLGQTCTATSGVVPVDSVALYAFPGFTSTSAKNDYTCPTSSPSTVSYTIPNTSPAYTPGTAPASNLMLPSGDSYQVIGFSNNYKSTDSAALNAASYLAIAAGDSGVTKCPGMGAPGGKGTYYAQVIYAAEADLATQQSNHPGSRNAMIILTDGDATACATGANTSAGACNSSSDITATEGTLNGTGTSTSVIYPSALGECGQAVLAAQYAAGQGTSVYTIGYGALTSGGCTTDAKYSASKTVNGVTWGVGSQPCAALQAMASAEVNFYSDDAQGSGEKCKAASPNNANLTQLTSIFRAITNNMTVPRLIPAGAS